MSEERVGAEVNMDEYMKVVDYDPNGDRVVENALNATNCNFAAEAANASKLGDRSAADYAVKSDLKGFQDTANAAQTTANNAQASATQAQGTATEAAVTAAEAKCTATAAQTTANEAKTGLNSKVDKIAGKQLSTNDYTTAEKTKLEGIEAGANKYTHPPKHPASMIEGLPEVVQGTGASITAVMSQNAVTEAIKLGEPVGCIKLFAGNVLPEGYLWCDGEAYSANGAYAKLFAVIGTIYNKSDDMAGSFRVPDMRGRVGVGKDAGPFNALGKIGGEVAHQLTEKENGQHTHVIKEKWFDGSGTHTHGSSIGYVAQGAINIPAGPSGISNDANAIITSGGGLAHNNLQPYLVCNYIIKY